MLPGALLLVLGVRLAIAVSRQPAVLSVEWTRVKLDRTSWFRGGWSGIRRARYLRSAWRTACGRANLIMMLVFWSGSGVCDEQYQQLVRPFFAEHCLRCHGPDDSRGMVTLHTVDGRMESEQSVQQWARILDVLEAGSMPPEGEPQPQDARRQAITGWIDAGIRAYVEQAEQVTAAANVRRLTNFEYQNTLRDLLGVDLHVIDSLPKDPVRPYRFHNTAEFMLLGPEQIDRYLEIARRVMASVIVEPERPETQVTRQEWNDQEVKNGFGSVQKRNEICIHNSPKGTPGQGMVIRDFPATGEFRIRFQAAAIFPNAAHVLPLRFVLGYNLNINSSTQEVEPVGLVELRSSADGPHVYELRGRIENFPVQQGKVQRGRLEPDSLTLTPQNIYDDGTLNDDNRFLYWPRQPEMPRAVVDWIEFAAPVTDVWPPEHHSRVLFESPLRESDPQAYVKQVLERFMSRAYRRPASAEEVQRFCQVYELLRPDFVSLEAAMRETLALVLVTPQFLLHTTGDGEVTTSQHELASRLSYFLWASMPDEELLRLAAAGRLDDADVIEQQVLRMLADGRSRDFVSSFTTQWLSLLKMKTVPINKDLFPRFLYYVEAGERSGTEEPYLPTIRDHMLDETVSFVGELIRRNAGVSQLVESDFAMLNQPLAAHYGVGGVEGVQMQPVPLQPEHHLGGLLTHGSVLIGNGTGSAPHPIYRAVWLREAILGEHVQAPPAEVPALSDSAGESAEQALTIRDLLARHRNTEGCSDCHVRLDPWGIPFEHYNAIGKYQPLVPKERTRVRGFAREKDGDLSGYLRYLESVNTESVQASARVPNGPEVDGMDQLKRHLLESRLPDIGQNVTRRLLSYALGRELTYRDRSAVDEILAQAASDGFPLRDLIVLVCQSGTFRGQTGALQ